MHVEVIYALPDRAHRVHLEVAPGTTVAEALAAVRRLPPFDALDPAETPLGVFGRRVSGDTVLEAGDRVEVYRALMVDPREARRRRAGDQPDRSDSA